MELDILTTLLTKNQELQSLELSSLENDGSESHEAKTSEFYGDESQDHFIKY